MRQLWSERLKQTVRPAVFRVVNRHRDSYRCPVCKYEGPFKDKVISKSEKLVRIDSKCPGCSSTERHRMMSLVIKDVFSDWNLELKSLLHIAPEACLRPMLSSFGAYHTADLEMKHVDFQEDLQSLSFPNEAYDAILVSRVLTIPPNLDACLDEMHRVLKPGGIAVVAETFTHEKNLEYGQMRNGRSRQIGLSLLTQLEQRFDRVERIASDRYPRELQLNNRMSRDGVPVDDYPAVVRIPNVGFRDLVAVCHKA